MFDAFIYRCNARFAKTLVKLSFKNVSFSQEKKRKLFHASLLQFCYFLHGEEKMKRRKKHTIFSASLLCNIIFENYAKLIKSFITMRLKERLTRVPERFQSPFFFFVASMISLLLWPSSFLTTFPLIFNYAFYWFVFLIMQRLWNYFSSSQPQSM